MRGGEERFISPIRRVSGYPPRMFALLLLACSENELVATKSAPEGDTAAAAVPAIVVSPESVAFGEVADGATASVVVAIENVGDGALRIEELSLGGGSTEITWTALSSPVVPAGSAVETVLTWAPTAGLPLADTLFVDSNDPASPRVEVPLSGTVPGGDIRVTPSLYDFGTLTVGDSATTVVTVANVGSGPLTIDSWTYVATDADLTVVDPGAFASTPAVLEPGASTELVVRYTPSAGGGDEASLEIRSDDADTPATGATHLGNGDDPCDGFTQTVELFLTADDSWQGWIDGVEFAGPNQSVWNQFDTFEWEMECGDHALSLYARDTGLTIAGVIAVVRVEGVVRFVSGPTDWTMTDALPPSGWTDPAFDDSGWHIPEVCADTSPWGSTPQPFYDLGASWIWWSTNCRDLGEAWLRLNFTVP